MEVLRRLELKRVERWAGALGEGASRHGSRGDGFQDILELMQPLCCVVCANAYCVSNMVCMCVPLRTTCEHVVVEWCFEKAPKLVLLLACRQRPKHRIALLLLWVRENLLQ